MDDSNFFGREVCQTAASKKILKIYKYRNKIRDLFKVKLYTIRSETKKKSEREKVRKKREKERKGERKKRKKKEKERKREKKERKKRKDVQGQSLSICIQFSILNSMMIHDVP